MADHEVAKQEICLKCGWAQVAGEWIDNVLRLFGYDTTPQLGLLIMAGAAQVRNRWEKS